MDRKEQIKQAKRLIATGIIKDLVEVLEKQFPELAESEDEKIRKEIITLLQEIAEDDDYCGRNHCDEYIAYLEKQKEQKPAEKQDYSGLNDLECAILRGFLAAGVENVPIGIIKETAKDCLTLIEQKPAEWSEEEKKHLYNAIEAVKYVYDVSEGTGGFKCVEFLKSLRPQPKQEWRGTEMIMLDTDKSNLMDVPAIIRASNHPFKENMALLLEKYIKR